MEKNYKLLSLFDNVVDTTGLYKNADGTPYEYHGHFSWIYVYNNQCELEINGENTTIMEWLAAKKNRLLVEKYNSKAGFLMGNPVI